jgi:aryl-alcohol dehydrogenase-like predicted oxidoreductase
MRYRMLGRSQLIVSEVGFGGWAISGEGWGPVDEETSVAALRRAIDIGVSFIDTADVYGRGHGEEVIARALDGKRHSAVIATKAGLRPGSGHDFSPGHVAAALEASLTRLGTDYVDVLQLHNPTRPALEDDELWETLRRLKAEGKARAYGASVRSPADGVKAIERGGVDTVQVVFNVVDQSAREFLDLAARENVGVVARVPLASGFLTGKYGVGHRFPPGDYRRSWTAATRARGIRGSKALEPVAAEVGSTRAQTALAFVLSYPGVSVTIPGVKTPVQAEENAAASEFAPLPGELRGHLERAHDAGFAEGARA